MTCKMRTIHSRSFIIHSFSCTHTLQHLSSLQPRNQYLRNNSPMLPSERLYLFRRQQRLTILEAAVHATVHTVQAFVESQKQFYCKTALHNNSSIGHYLVDFWLSHSHNEVTRPELGVTVDTFKFILKELKMYVSPPLADSKHITAEEQLAIFLWICRAAAGSRKAASRFHHCHDTIQR